MLSNYVSPLDLIKHVHQNVSHWMNANDLSFYRLHCKKYRQS